jgi:hypothetical protein
VLVPPRLPVPPRREIPRHGPEGIVVWLGLFSAAVNGLSLFAQALLAPRLLERLGIRRILPVLPTTVTVGVLAAVTLHFAGAPNAAFLTIVFTRLAERVLTRGNHELGCAVSPRIAPLPHTRS